jgi:hypothetical protein
VGIWQAPWAQFSFATEKQREQFANKIRELKIDVLIVGPLTRVGMDAAGTLQEVNEFTKLIADVRRRCGRRLAVILVHHENRAGTVSGAWEQAGETLLHVKCPCNGKTVVKFEQARWSSTLHCETWTLRWTPGEGFEVEAERDYRAEIVAFLVAHP